MCSQAPMKTNHITVHWEKCIYGDFQCFDNIGEIIRYWFLIWSSKSQPSVHFTCFASAAQCVTAFHVLHHCKCIAYCNMYDITVPVTPLHPLGHHCISITHQCPTSLYLPQQYTLSDITTPVTHQCPTSLYLLQQYTLSDITAPEMHHYLTALYLSQQ